MKIMKESGSMSGNTIDIPTLITFDIPGGSYRTIKGLLHILTNTFSYSPTHLPGVLVSVSLEKSTK